jgi:ADP-dependent NAD(P)H-hydrate dehydratase / NAD(P)H-hydrate epimerase
MKGLKTFLKRPKKSHKGDYGRLLIVAGSRGMSGAAYLASMAALRSGCGVVTLGIPRSLNTVLEKRAVEVITKPLPETSTGSLSSGAISHIQLFLKQTDALCLGPGLSTHPRTRALVHQLLPKLNCPTLIDADGLNCIADRTGLLKASKASIVITPHAGELSRLIKVPTRKINQDRIQTAITFSRKSGTVVLLKGHRTVVASPEGKYYLNMTGNPGMATAGSGDVLSGILSAFLAQGADSYHAACWAAYLHGLSGDRAARQKGETSLIASDILEFLPAAFKFVR